MKSYDVVYIAWSRCAIMYCLFAVESLFILYSYDVYLCSLEPGENIEENKRNLMMLTQKVFDVIVASSER